MTVKRALAHVLGATALVCVGGVLDTDPAAANEADCVDYGYWTGFVPGMEAAKLMEEACHQGASSGETHACWPQMMQAVKRHNQEVWDPYIPEEQGDFACKLAVHGWWPYAP
jgi:hypothetical protein